MGLSERTKVRNPAALAASVVRLREKSKMRGNIFLYRVS